MLYALLNIEERNGMTEQIKDEKFIKDLAVNIIKECYWDYNITEDDILNIIESDDFRLKQKLFSKIIYNSRDRIKSLQIFKRDELKKLFNSFSTGKVYHEKYIIRHLLVLRNIFLDENNIIEGLEWKKR
jgi:hypothetical protein